RLFKSLLARPAAAGRVASASRVIFCGLALCAQDASMNSNVDTTDNETATETVTEESVVRKAVKQKDRSLFLVEGAILIVALGFLEIRMRSCGTGVVPHVSHEPTMEVNVVHPEKIPATTTVELPGQTQAYTDAPIFAQTSGYLKAWYFDIGAKVKAGDVLAEIDTPEVDQELAQAQAQVKVAQSALDLAEVTYRRSQNLFNRKVIAEQDFDTAADTYRENQAMVLADQ